jgi:hypothetical protein
VASHKEVPHLHTHTGRTAVGSPWYGPSWEEAWIPQGRKRASWPRWQTTLEPARHLPPPHGQKPPAWKDVAQTDWRVACPPLRSILTGIRQPRAPHARSPRPKTEKSSHEAEAREAKSPPDPSPPHQRMRIYYGSSSPAVLCQSLSLSLSSCNHVTPLEARLVAHPRASTDKSAPHVSPCLSPRPYAISRAQ